MSKKRGNGEGTITRRKSGSWAAQYVVYTAQGRKRKTLYGKTRAEVAAKLAKALSDREGGLTFETGTLTLGEYMARWLNGAVQGTVRQSTYKRYEQMTRVHIVPALGCVKLKGLTPAHLRGLYREKLNSGLAPRTVQYIHCTLHNALKQAVNDGLIPRNAASAVKAPRPAKKEVKPLSPKQANVFLKAARSDRFEALYVLAITSGMRKGELLGLKWDDVDLDAGKLQMRRALSITTGGYTFDTPKSGKGRSIKLTARAREVLMRHRKAQLEERIKFAGLWQDHGLVFPTRVGNTNEPQEPHRPLIQIAT